MGLSDELLVIGPACHTTGSGVQVLELGWRPEIPEHLPEGYKSFVRQCWEEDREKVGVVLAAGCCSCLFFKLLTDCWGFCAMQ